MSSKQFLKRFFKKNFQNIFTAKNTYFLTFRKTTKKNFLKWTVTPDDGNLCVYKNKTKKYRKKTTKMQFVT